MNAGSRVPRGIDRQAVLDGKSQFGGFYVYERQEPAVSSAEFPVVLVPPDPEYRAWYLKIVRDLMSHQGQLQTFEPIANYKDAEVIAALKLRLNDNLVHELGFKLPERTTHGSTFFIMTPDVPPLKAEPNIEKSRTYIIRKAAWNALRQMEVQVDPPEFDANVSGVTAEAPPTRSDLKAERDARRLWWPRPLPPQRGGGELVAAPMDDGPDGVESDLPLLSSLPNLRGFYLEDVFSPNGWDEIGRLKQFEILECNSNYITDRYLNCLLYLADLKELALYGNGPKLNPFTDANLDFLDVSAVDLTNEQLAIVAARPTLKKIVFNIRHNTIIDEWRKVQDRQPELLWNEGNLVIRAARMGNRYFADLELVTSGAPAVQNP